MKLISRKQIEDTTAHPSNEALGFNMDAELDKAMNTALKPIAAKLREYKAEDDRLKQVCERWTPDALAEKLNEIATLAQAGDEQAAEAISNGAIPTKAAYNDMAYRASLALERFRYDKRTIFAEAAPLIRKPMEAVVERGQRIVDQATKDFGLPEYKLTGYTNHIDFLVGELEKAGNNLSHTLDTFWLRFK
jgi:hypothetical protein